MNNPTEACGTLGRADGLLTADVDGELLMMSVEQGRYFNLNSVGSRIWELLAAPVAVDGLVDALTAEYDVAPDEARREVERFLGALRKRGLLVTDNASAA
ncbi:lasso peptide biosynthesis PqqD family chaperone [Niveispirillum sp. SYP-B3756]|uniref:lasso peptide biosynthesis PqqD family chaperone n=1 Tax=Niveispirillum sp. SYP-B3756 TaxID=2662178 RepID=UPI00129199F3|nr:lasso peptide biosynthesis PqqD family chaperone [Niveispirillum sp. SYP-B3756]MQP68589.1 lasso peptide biosynthesis PqqD family chaperone [Niveispirillum sp. SYP-B3756]